jgi:hypothetical protein
MRFTERDLKITRDISLSHLLSRDQTIKLGYFGSVTRANTRLRELCNAKILRRLSTPFFGQSLYMAGSKAEDLVGERIAPLLNGRLESPRFVRHALSVSETRIALIAKGAKEWRFEQQLWRNVGNHAIRPDGLALTNSTPIFVEVDLGHVTPQKFKEKLLGYSELAKGETCRELYGFQDFRLIVVTTGPRRSRQLRSLLPDSKFGYLVQTFEELGVPLVGGWS